jgi:hypothetical protein
VVGTPMRVSSGVVALPHSRNEAVKKWEGNMRNYTILELFRFSKTELLGLHRWFSGELRMMPAYAPERPATFRVLRKIRRVMALRRLLSG